MDFPGYALVLRSSTQCLSEFFRSMIVVDANSLTKYVIPAMPLGRKPVGEMSKLRKNFIP
jgi:hypothetical protein